MSPRSCSRGPREKSWNRAPIRSSVDTGAGAFLSARVREVAEAVAVGRPFVSLAAPTHAGGWIDPAVLVEATREPAQPPSTLDLVAAILRLAPDGRDAALASAAGLTGESGAVVRYALGGDESIGETAPWWVAAARVRAPGVDDPAVERRHPGLGPDAGLAARIRLFTGTPDPAQLDLGDQDRGRTAPARRDRCRPADRADAPHPVVVLLERAIRPGHVPLDGDDPACLSRALVRDRRTADRPERRLVVGRMGEPSLPRAARQALRPDRLHMGGCCWGSRWEPKEAGERGLGGGYRRARPRGWPVGGGRTSPRR